MKRGGPQHRKLKRLSRLLGVRRHAAVGLVELLHHACARETPRGDIGRLADEDIAEELDWVDDPSVLVSALEAAGLIDPHDEHRYLVHDWPDHCDDAVHMALCRARKSFCDGRLPRPARIGGPERERIDGWLAAARAHSVRTDSARRAHAVRTALPSPPLPSREEEETSRRGEVQEGGAEPPRRTRASRGAGAELVESVLGAAQRRLDQRRGTA